MTVPSTTRRAGPYPGNGVATSFPFAFKVFAKTDIAVVFANSLGVESTLVLDSDYSVTLNADQNTNPGGSITYPIIGSPMTATQALAIVGGLDYSQTSALPTGGAYNATIVERALDRITILTQQLRETVNRGVQLAFTTASNVSSRLPAPRGGSVLGWAADGLSLTNLDAAGLGVSVSYANWRTQTFNGTGAQAAFVLLVDAGVASNCDVTVGGVAQTPDINYSYDAISKTLTFLTGAPPVGTNNVVVRYGQALPQGSITALGITDATSTGRAVLTAANAAAARTAIGAVASGGDIGAATATTQPSTDNSTKVATTAMVQSLAGQANRVLQVQTYTDAGSSTTNTSYTNVSQSFKNFTPRSTNSTLIVECVFAVNVGITGGSNTTGSVVFYDTIAASTLGNAQTYGVANASGGLQFTGHGTLKWSIANGSTATRSLALRALSSLAGNTVSIQNHFWTIIEVQN